MKYSLYLIPSFLTLALVGCVSQIAAPTSQPTPAAVIATPTMSPSSLASNLPSPSLQLSPTPSPGKSFSLLRGQLFSSHTFVGPTQAILDSGLEYLYVVDAITSTDEKTRYGLLQFRPDGSLVADSRLEPTNGISPTAVDGVAIDIRGVPIVNYRNQDSFLLYKSIGPSMMLADRYPVFNLPKTGPTAISSQGEYLNVAAVNLDPDKAGRTDGFIYLGRAKEDKAPEVLYRLPDPFNPTVRMALSREGDLFLAGTTKEGSLTLMRIGSDQMSIKLPVGLSSIPDGLWAGEDGQIYLGWNSGGQPARVRRYSRDGALTGETEVKLAGGGMLNVVHSLHVNAQGEAIVTGTGFSAENKPLKAVVTFLD